MRHLVVRRGVPAAHIDSPGEIAVVAHVWEMVFPLRAGVARFPLDSVAKVRHGRQRDGHWRWRKVFGVRLGRHGPVSLNGSVGVHNHVLGRRRVR
jgi:hypothetical protein